jgi:hypothetical protein
MAAKQSVTREKTLHKGENSPQVDTVLYLIAKKITLFHPT